MLVGSSSFFGFLLISRVLGVLGAIDVALFGFSLLLLLLLVDDFDACGIGVVAMLCIS